jgi:hypothetical protein
MEPLWNNILQNINPPNITSGDNDEPYIVRVVRFYRFKNYVQSLLQILIVNFSTQVDAVEHANAQMFQTLFTRAIQTRDEIFRLLIQLRELKLLMHRPTNTNLTPYQHHVCIAYLIELIQEHQLQPRIEYTPQQLRELIARLSRLAQRMPRAEEPTNKKIKTEK